MADASFLPSPISGAGVETVVRCPARRLRRSGETDSISATLWIGMPRNGILIFSFGGTSGASRMRGLVVVGRGGFEGMLRRVEMGLGWRKNDGDGGVRRGGST